MSPLLIAASILAVSGAEPLAVSIVEPLLGGCELPSTLQEQHFPTEEEAQAEEERQASFLGTIGPSAGIGLGFWANLLDFDAKVPSADLDLDLEMLTVVRAGIGLRPPRLPVYFEIYREYAVGSEVNIDAIGLEVGVRIYEGPLIVERNTIDLKAAVSYSSLEVERPEFGKFDSKPAYMAGLVARSYLASRLTLDLVGELRFARYPYADPVISGDSAAISVGAVFLLSVTASF